MVCGGFVNGSRVNDVYSFEFNPQSKSVAWNLIYSNPSTPLPRNSHTSTVIGDNLYILGGQDDENNKLDDLWVLNLGTGKISEVGYDSSGET